MCDIHFLHLTNVAMESEAHQRRIEDFKEKWGISERKRTKLQTDFDKQSQDLQALKSENARLIAETKSLQIQKSQSEGCLNSSESSNLEKDKKLLALGKEKDEALQLLRAREQELGVLKSATNRDNIIVDFKKIERLRVGD